jgi:polysaccharide export outer membrane protein
MAGCLLLVACSKNYPISPSTVEAPPQFLEEVAVEDKDSDEVMAQLQALQNVKTDQYHISPGDRFNIYVYDEPDLNTEGVVVKPDGAISFKLIGEVAVGGLTVAEATTLMEEKLTEFIRYPKVSLIPYELTGARVTLMGKVAEPGTYEILSNMRVMDAIATAGGLSTGYFQNNTIELADLERSYIVRDNKVLPVNLQALVREGDMLHNIPLLNGDYIYISSSVNREVYVLGEVGSPNHFLYKESMTLMQVISFAGGFLNTANLNVVVVRGGLTHPRVFKVDIKAILAGKSKDFPLKPNDIIYVSRSPLASWNNILQLLMPSLEAVQSGWMLQEIMRN